MLSVTSLILLRSPIYCNYISEWFTLRKLANNYKDLHISHLPSYTSTWMKCKSERYQILNKIFKLEFSFRSLILIFCFNNKNINYNPHLLTFKVTTLINFINILDYNDFIFNLVYFIVKWCCWLIICDYICLSLAGWRHLVVDKQFIIH